MKSSSSEWEMLDFHERMEAITEQMHSISTDGIAPTSIEWNARRPKWMPKTSAIGNYYAVQFVTISMCLGYKTKSRQTRNPGFEPDCECGAPLIDYRLATVGTEMSGTQSAVLIPLCGECAALWDELETSWRLNGTTITRGHRGYRMENLQGKKNVQNASRGE